MEEAWLRAFLRSNQGDLKPIIGAPKGLVSLLDIFIFLNERLIESDRITKMKPKTREKLLKIGEKLFSSKGFHGVSVRELAKSAGTNIASVHYHFGDKYGLYEAIFDQYFSQVRGSIEEAKIEKKDPKKQILLLNQIMQNNLRRYPHFARMLYRAMLSQGDTRINAILRKLILNHMKPLVQQLGRVASQLRWKGSKKKVPPEAFLFLIISMNSYWSLFSSALVNAFTEHDTVEQLREAAFNAAIVLLKEFADS